MKSPSILVTWFGSLPGHGTIGDLLAVQSVISRLVASGFAVSHISETSEFRLQGRKVSLERVDPHDVDFLIFVCGPILKGHPICDLLERFPNTRKIGVSVSLMPPTSANYTQPFDVVFAREGGSVPFADVSALAPMTTRILERHRDGLRVGLALRGPQSEYGEEQCLDGTVSELSEAAILALRASKPVQVIPIEHHLVRAARDPSEIEGLYADCDLIITSRFHGGILSLRNSVPFIAIDQILGGAKVYSLLQRTGWPCVFRADSVSKESICSAAQRIVTESCLPLIQECAESCCRSARQTLDALEAEIRRL